MKRSIPLKIISFYSNEKALIKKAIAGHRPSQQCIYDHFAPKMLGVCRCYIKDLQFAEDVMISAFVKAFLQLRSFRHEGSFEGWIRRIMVRDCISYLRKRQFVVFDEDRFADSSETRITATNDLDLERIEKIIDDLPEGYRMVFVLYAVEGYRHSEIAELLSISESTSKSQLFKARKVLQEKISHMQNIGRTQDRPQ
jgi:RNA polymerase sigma-70 factor (ECF subfamily)